MFNSVLSCLIESFEKLFLLFNADIHSHNNIIRKRSDHAFSLVLTSHDFDLSLNFIAYNLQKVIIGGIVAAVIVSGDNVDICEGINCGIGGNCTGGNCTCQTPFVNVENFCKNLCEGIKCGSGGACLNGICGCRTGYINVENFCEQTCELGPCKELIKIRQ